MQTNREERKPHSGHFIYFLRKRKKIQNAKDNDNNKQNIFSENRKSKTLCIKRNGYRKQHHQVTAHYQFVQKKRLRLRVIIDAVRNEHHHNSSGQRCSNRKRK